MTNGNRMKFSKVRSGSVDLEIGEVADIGTVTARLNKWFVKEAMNHIENEDAIMAHGIQDGSLRVQEVPGNCISFDFHWNGHLVERIKMKRKDSLEFLGEARKKMKKRSLAKAFA